VVLYVIEGGGHTWPGALDRPGLGRITQSVNATELIWRFFEEHPRR
jgi:polyhydroxybutyrate depolymerase